MIVYSNHDSCVFSPGNYWAGKFSKIFTKNNHFTVAILQIFVIGCFCGTRLSVVFPEYSCKNNLIVFHNSLANSEKETAWGGIWTHASRDLVISDHNHSSAEALDRSATLTWECQLQIRSSRFGLLTARYMFLRGWLDAISERTKSFRTQSPRDNLFVLFFKQPSFARETTKQICLFEMSMS